MNGYESFKTEFVSHLTNIDLPDGVMEKILHAADLTAQRYTIARTETSIIAAENSFPEVAKLFLVARTVEERSKNTIDLYRYTLTKFFNAIRKPVGQISSNDIRLYLANYKSLRQVKNITIATIRNIIGNFFEWCTFSGYLSVNPVKFIMKVKTEKHPRSAMSSIELEHLRSVCCTLREKAMIDFLFSTGCRVSEMCNAKIANINWLDHSIYIEHGKGDVSRTVYLNAEAEVSLRAYLSSRKRQSVYIFTAERNISGDNPLCSRQIQKIVRKIQARAEVVKTHVTPHILRHTMATTALGNGMPIEQVQQLLGHANINTTLIYAKVNQSDVQRSHQRYVN